MKKYLAIGFTTLTLLFSAACNDVSEDALDSYVDPDNRDYPTTDINYEEQDPSIGEMKSLETKIPSHKFPHSTIVKKNVAIYKLDLGKGQAPMYQKTPPQTLPKQDASQQEVAPDKGQTPAKQGESQAAEGLSAFEAKVVELTNVERKKNGLPPLKADTSLSQVARKKSDDMKANNYFSHTSPTYGSPFDMIRDFGISYKTAGENIAKGQTSPQSVVNGWMNSEGHRKNILSKDFTHIGVGFNDAGKYWTQMFIGK